MNSYIAALNLFIATAWLSLCVTFFVSFFWQMPTKKIERVFLVGMGAAYFLLSCDYATTSILRLEDAASLPAYAFSSTGIILLVIWRALLATLVVSLVAYIVVFNRAGMIDEEEEHEIVGKIDDAVIQAEGHYKETRDNVAQTRQELKAASYENTEKTEDAAATVHRKLDWIIERLDEIERRQDD